MTTAAPADAMRRLWDEVIETAAGVNGAQWHARVPWCPAWSVGDLVAHLGGLQSAFNGEPQPDPPRDWTAPPGATPFDEAMGPMVAARAAWTPQQRLDELRRAADGHAAHLAQVADWDAEAAGPVGPTTQAGLYRVRAFDVWVHLQDLREALGRPVAVRDSGPGAAAAFDYVIGLLPWLYGKRVAAPEGAALRMALGAPADHDGVLQVVGGRAGWHDEADPGDGVVEATPAALTLLTSGRGTPERWRAEDVLQWRGSRGDEFVARARMF